MDNIMIWDFGNYAGQVYAVNILPGSKQNYLLTNTKTTTIKDAGTGNVVVVLQT